MPTVSHTVDSSLRLARFAGEASLQQSLPTSCGRRCVKLTCQALMLLPTAQARTDTLQPAVPTFYRCYRFVIKSQQIFDLMFQIRQLKLTTDCVDDVGSLAHSQSLPYRQSMLHCAHLCYVCLLHVQLLVRSCMITIRQFIKLNEMHHWSLGETQS